MNCFHDNCSDDSQFFPTALDSGRIFGPHASSNLRVTCIRRWGLWEAFELWERSSWMGCLWVRERDLSPPLPREDTRRSLWSATRKRASPETILTLTLPSSRGTWPVTCERKLAISKLPARRYSIMLTRIKICVWFGKIILISLN